MVEKTYFDDHSGTTPVRGDSKKTRGILTHTKMDGKELADDVQDCVEEDFDLHYRVTDTEAFLAELLPVDQEVVDAIFKSLVEKSLYDSTTKRWESFPDPKDKEKEKALYGPFATIAEAIRKEAENQRKAKSDMGNTKWADFHTKSPESQDRDAAKLRPDMLLALELLSNLAQNAKVDEKKIWWLQIIAMVEMKCNVSLKWQEVVKQLLGYLCRVLREQLDRRFVFGLTMGPQTMTMWLYDRSGVIGMNKAIDIHKDPKKFIQVIAAFSLLSPSQLGFDPKIKILLSDGKAIPPYQPSKECVSVYKETPFNRRWVIKMNDGKEYATVRTLSSVRAGLMRGRGSIIWAVVPYPKGKEDVSESVRVLKQSWCPCNAKNDGTVKGEGIGEGIFKNEGTLYEEANGAACDYVGKISLCEEVEVSGKPDTTHLLIRQGLDVSMGDSRKRGTIQRPESSDTGIYVRVTGIDDIREIDVRDTGPPVPRVRIRVLLSTYGWVIKYFSTRTELLEVLRDAIKGHKYLYRNGVLHRDVSPGNILIKWSPKSDASEPSRSGCLIDLDHAKQGKNGLPRPEVVPPPDFVDMICSMLKALGKVVENVVVYHALQFASVELAAMEYVTAAIKHAMTFRSLQAGQLVPSEDLQWQPVQILHNFDFDATECRKGSRTGTLPYMSGEILDLGRYFFDRHTSKRFFHDAVHDLESFFWVLVHICLTRQGPGGIRRDELGQDNETEDKSKKSPGLRRVIYCFFDSTEVNMTANKRRLFQGDLETFKAHILGNFHSHFKDLKPLVEEWFCVLQLAHKFHGFEYHHIHDMVLDIFDRAIRLLESLPDQRGDEAVQKVLANRKAEIRELCGDSVGVVQHSPPPHTSPSLGGERQGCKLPVYSPPGSPTPARALKKARMLTGSDPE